MARAAGWGGVVTILAKPSFGSPCNGCGVCCKVTPCLIAIEVIGAAEWSPCPVLELEDGRYWCGLLRSAHKHIPGLEAKPWVDGVFRNMLMATGAFGTGCDSDD